MDFFLLKTVLTRFFLSLGVPESQTRRLNKEAKKKNVGIIGPATVGGIKPGSFRIGNAGGMLDNVVMSKLYRPGSVAYVSRSGGLSNELNNMISRNSDGVYEGIAIGGDRYPGSRFLDHILRYNDNPDVHMLVLVGEVGGVDEYEVCDALKSKRITKPLVARCIGTCADAFSFEVQFGHAGALARGKLETATAKNQALKEAGAKVPDNFFELGNMISEVYNALVDAGTLVPAPEPEPPKIPMDYSWAKRLGLVRKPAHFVSSISDDRGEELTYCGMPISEVFEKDLGIGGVVSLLWFRRQLPTYATKFIEMILMVTADHGPAVSGAHNTIVCARAGKDLPSALASGLLTIGPRFGGALDEAAADFSAASDAGLDAEQFVANQRKANKLVMGIGHRIKSLSNPDKRVEIIKECVYHPVLLTPMRDSSFSSTHPCGLLHFPQIRAEELQGRNRAQVCARGGTSDDKEEGQFDSQRRWVHRGKLCRYAPQLWRLQP
jgi:ATP citrate (pro-S)-lyase